MATQGAEQPSTTSMSGYVGPVSAPLQTGMGARRTSPLTNAIGYAIIVIPIYLGRRVEVLVNNADVTTAAPPVQTNITVTATEAASAAEDEDDETACDDNVGDTQLHEFDHLTGRASQEHAHSSHRSDNSHHRVVVEGGEASDVFHNLSEVDQAFMMARGLAATNETRLLPPVRTETVKADVAEAGAWVPAYDLIPVDNMATDVL